MSLEISEIVEKLALTPHPEGGFYKETYRSKETISQEELYPNFEGSRNYSTGIYFLLTSDNFSAFHRIKQDEMWHFYMGSPLFVHVIYQDGTYKRYTLGTDFYNMQMPQLVVPAGCWFASSVKHNEAYSLVGCTVAPGFDFDDFELAERNKLISEFPEHKTVITELTRV
ncbi:cupin domain-containing protein [Aquimarina sp. D1M17]|uniref:cupin domain-containing protein n=1 Tax=Aquimarina acroporae TaxID=2937283 RepID=UPI0020BF7348|nr:cupin domain-containing protein [Aquimarina acroporae]MCK8522078.1 cupin domain-containing protein [Aquimarina acroporae]